MPPPRMSAPLPPANPVTSACREHRVRTQHTPRLSSRRRPHTPGPEGRAPPQCSTSQLRSGACGAPRRDAAEPVGQRDDRDRARRIRRLRQPRLRKAARLPGDEDSRGAWVTTLLVGQLRAAGPRLHRDAARSRHRHELEPQRRLPGRHPAVGPDAVACATEAMLMVSLTDVSDRVWAEVHQGEPLLGVMRDIGSFGGYLLGLPFFLARRYIGIGLRGACAAVWHFPLVPVRPPREQPLPLGQLLPLGRLLPRRLLPLRAQRAVRSRPGISPPPL